MNTKEIDDLIFLVLKSVDIPAFCYGPIKVIKVTDVNEKTYEHGLHGYNEIQVSVDIDYEVVDVPEWAIKNQKKLDALYPQINLRLPEKVYPHSIIFIKGKDGHLYQDSLSYELIPPSGKLLTDKE